MALVLRGRALFPHAKEGRFDLISDALIEIDDYGIIRAAGPAPSGCNVPESHPGTVLLPGFIDTHIHFPQTRILGSASGPLLDWLERSVFPEEARFADHAYAEAVAREFCGRLIAQGTTCAAVYSSSHPGATDALFHELERSGLRAISGLTLMDRGAPGAVLLSAPAAADACEQLLGRWHGHDRGRLGFSVIPRFALSCTPELLKMASELARRHQLLIQTHISENQVEIQETLRAFPSAKDYLDVYESFGLVGERTLLAHCIWLSPSEWERAGALGAAVAHCPDSNFFLGSGCMGLRRAAEHCRVGLGTDMGAGRTFSLRRISARGFDAAQLLGAPIAPEELLWRATTGGAAALGLDSRVGQIATGFEADLTAVDAPDGLSRHQLIDSLLFDEDAGPVRATWVRGRLLTTS
jgi:guanine deaminase